LYFSKVYHLANYSKGKEGIKGIRGDRGIRRNRGDKGEEWNSGTFEQTCLRKPHERVVGRIVGANNVGSTQHLVP